MDARSDLWSMGVVLYEALSDQLLFETNEITSLLFAICFGSPVPLGSRAPWVPPEVIAVVDKALQRDPAERPQSAAEMLEEVRRLLRGGSEITEKLLVPLPPEVRAAGADAATAALPSPPSRLVPVAAGVPLPTPQASALTERASIPQEAQAAVASPVARALPVAPVSPTVSAAPLLIAPAASPGKGRAIWILVAVLGLAAGLLAALMVSRPRETSESAPDAGSESVGAAPATTTTAQLLVLDAGPAPQPEGPADAAVPPTRPVTEPARPSGRSKAPAGKPADAFGSGNK